MISHKTEKSNAWNQQNLIKRLTRYHWLQITNIIQYININSMDGLNRLEVAEVRIGY